MKKDFPSPGESIRVTCEIWNGGDGFFPDQLCARPGAVLEVISVEQSRIVARHHGLSGPGLYLAPHEWKPANCRCDHIKRDVPCWVVPIPIAHHGMRDGREPFYKDEFDDVPKGACRACGHLPTCHTHTTRTTK